MSAKLKQSTRRKPVVRHRPPSIPQRVSEQYHQMRGLLRQLPDYLTVQRVVFGFIAMFAIFIGGVMPAFAAITSGDARPPEGYAITAAHQDTGQTETSPVSRSERTTNEDEELAEATQAAEQEPEAEQAPADPAPAEEAAAEPVAAEAPAPGPVNNCASGEHVVQPDETLASIAAAIGYRDAEDKPDYNRIHLCNKDLLGDNPNLIRVGWVLKLDNPAPDPALAAETAPAPPPAPAPAPAQFVNPLDGSSYTCTSGFGPRWGTQHGGVDMALPIGNPVKAAEGGIVKRAGETGGFGLAVVVLGDSGMYYEYGHVDVVNVGMEQRVNAGDIVALSGNRGQSTGPHLHFAVGSAFFGGHIDPEVWMSERGVTLC